MDANGSFRNGPFRNNEYVSFVLQDLLFSESEKQMRDDSALF